jgi:hypothetical protein
MKGMSHPSLVATGRILYVASYVELAMVLLPDVASGPHSQCGELYRPTFKRDSILYQAVGLEWFLSFAMACMYWLYILLRL